MYCKRFALLYDSAMVPSPTAKYAQRPSSNVQGTIAFYKQVLGLELAAWNPRDNLPSPLPPSATSQTSQQQSFRPSGDLVRFRGIADAYHFGNTLVSGEPLISLYHTLHERQTWRPVFDCADLLATHSLALANGAREILAPTNCVDMGFISTIATPTDDIWIDLWQHNDHPFPFNPDLFRFELSTSAPEALSFYEQTFDWSRDAAQQRFVDNAGNIAAYYRDVVEGVPSWICGFKVSALADAINQALTCDARLYQMPHSASGLTHVADPQGQVFGLFEAQ